MKMFFFITCAVGLIAITGVAIFDRSNRAAFMEGFYRTARQCENTGGSFRPVRYVSGGKGQSVPVYDCVR